MHRYFQDDTLGQLTEHWLVTDRQTGS